MSLVRRPPGTDSRQAGREIVLWTTRDGREIPLDDMSDEHIANAIRALSVWRNRLKTRAPDDPVIGDLEAAIARFKDLQRRRRKSAIRSARLAASTATAPEPAAPRVYARSSSRTSGLRPRKPVAKT